jgi:hypothetical protein
MVWLYGQNQDSLRIDDKGVTINGNLTLNGELILQNGWRIYSTGPYSLRFDRGSDAVMAIGGYLEYKFPGVPYFYQLIKDPFEENSNRAYWNSKSDSRLKTDVSIIPSALAKVNKLNGITFRWNQAALDYFTRDLGTSLSAGPDAATEANQKVWNAERARRYKELTKTNVGVMAQDVEAVLPEAVTTDEAGYKNVAYHELIPLLIQAIKEEDKISKEQARTIEQQQSEIQRLILANGIAQQQLTELQELKQKLAYLEATLDNVVHTGLAGVANSGAATRTAGAPAPTFGSK